MYILILSIAYDVLNCTPKHVNSLNKPDEQIHSPFKSRFGSTVLC
jgi:hypothetical protein